MGAATGGTLKIATVGTFSGPSSSLGAPLRDAVVAWSKAVNDNGGINGRKIDLVVGDDAGDPAKAVSLVKDLIENQHVIAFVGVETPIAQESWADYALQQGIPIIGGNAATASWTSKSNFFAWAPTLAARNKAQETLAKRAGKTNMFIFYAAEIAAAKSTVALMSPGGAAYVDGMNIVGSAAVSATASDYTAECLAARDKNASSVELNLDSGTSVRIVKACEQQGFKPTWVVPSSVWGTSTTTQEFDGALTYDSTFMTSSSMPNAQRFVAAMKKYSPSTNLNGSSRVGWVAGLMFESIAPKLPTDPTKGDVLEAMNSIVADDFGVLPEKVTFTAGAPHANPPCVWTATYKSGQDLTPDPAPLCA